MAVVQWETVPQEAYDDMVAVLLNTLHPDAERLDSRGGDGGRDVGYPQSVHHATGHGLRRTHRIEDLGPFPT